MPHKVLERQYQLLAQKRHEQNLKLDYYKQTARYFEREAALARQFSSWTNRGPDNYSERLKKSKREEQLRARREKLKRLLVEEEQLYRHELGLQKHKRQQPSKALSLEQLKLNLLERKAEESLYYPSSYRKLQAHTCSPTDSFYKLTNKSDITTATNERYSDQTNGSLNHHVNHRPISANSQRRIRFSSSPSIEKILYNNAEDEKWSYAGSTSSKVWSEKSYQNPRYSARYSRRSLEGTNICNTDKIDYYSSTFKNLELNGSPTPLVNNDQDDTYTGTTLKSNHEDNEEDIVQLSQNEKLVYDKESLHKNDNKCSLSSKEADCSTTLLNHKSSESPVLIEPQVSISSSSADTLRNSNMDGYENLNDYKKETDCTGGSNMSVQMYRYLKHNELKHKILDLCKREHIFVIKQFWSEALRLREMRNEITLLKNKNIFENLDLKINEEIRKCGLQVIQAREALNKKRTKLCNSLFYSDEAKTMWKQWVREDDEVTKIENNVMRNLLMHQLEEDWKNLALRDKNRMSQLYHRIMKKSYLQDEHKLIDVIRLSNDR